jgi:hypothetical protein
MNRISIALRNSFMSLMIAFVLFFVSLDPKIKGKFSFKISFGGFLLYIFISPIAFFEGLFYKKKMEEILNE